MISHFWERAGYDITQLGQFSIQFEVMLNIFVLSLSFVPTCVSLNLYKLSGYSEYNDESIFEYSTHSRPNDMDVDSPTPAPIMISSGDTPALSDIVGTEITGILN